VNLGLTELVLIMLVLIATLMVPALVLYLVFAARRRRGRAETGQETLAEGPHPDRRHR
jgi:heme/copper-type cytochrome/quinol oxidase subunit 2